MRVQSIGTQATVVTLQALRNLALASYYDLFVLATVALLAPGWVTIPLPVVRVLLGLTFVLCAPGYALTAALLPRRKDLDGVARAALSLGLSVALLPVFALVLDATGSGIRQQPMVYSLSIWIFVWCVLAAFRRSRLALLQESFLPVPTVPKHIPTLVDGVRKRRVYASMVTIILFIPVLTLLLPDPTARPTEFYILGNTGRAEEYPRQATTNEDLLTTLGITNGAWSDQTYRIEVWASNPGAAASRSQVAQVGPVTLAAGDTWEQPVSWRMPWAGDDQHVEFLLFSEGSPEPYRRLLLWVNVVQ